MAKYIIFLDGELKGYLNDESSTKRAVSDLADRLIEEIKLIPASKDVRVYRENIESGINIYSQTTGTYFNGCVFLQHTITWKSLPEYKQS
jgi:hypothetical protein